MAAIPKMTSEAAASKYNLSKRGAENFVDGDHWVPFEKALENAWDKEKNPNGIVFAWPPYMIQDVWAGMLEDRSFLDSFLAENKKRLAENYILATNFLDEHGIEYFKGGNAGVFIWADFRPYFSPELKVTKLERESQVMSTCSHKNVFIGYGSNFFTEEVGWFRITFSCPREALLEGLERITKSLNSIPEIR